MKEVMIVLGKEQEEIIRNYPFKTENFDENNKVDVTLAIHKIFEDYNNLVDIAEKELVSVFNENEMNQLYKAFKNITYNEEIQAKKFLYDSIATSENVTVNVVDKIIKLSNTQAYVVLRKIYEFYWEDGKITKEYYANYTEEEKAEIDREWAEAEDEEWIKEHTMICPKCGQQICDQAPNGAGELVDCGEWHCDICGWTLENE